MSGTSSWAERGRLSLLRIDRSAVLGLTLLAVAAVVAALVLTVQSRPHTVAFTGDGSAAPASVPASGSGVDPTVGALTERTVVVDVVGRVKRPGLVTVPAGSRVWDVVEAAGGFTRAVDRPSVNLARVVTDGEQVVIGPIPGGSIAAPGGGAGAVAGAPPGTAAPVDLNTATLEGLETLPGVGPVLAQRILDHRSAQGPFRSVEELRDISGIGDKTFADLAPRVRV